MTEVFSLLYIFLSKYLSPFLFVIGLIYLVYGSIEYFVVGLGGDEGRAQNGRNLLLKSISWFTLAILVYAAIAFFGWLGSLAVSTLDEAGGKSSGDVNINRNEEILTVPNVPRGNE
jgi:hypothetical protein